MKLIKPENIYFAKVMNVGNTELNKNTLKFKNLEFIDEVPSYKDTIIIEEYVKKYKRQQDKTHILVRKAKINPEIEVIIYPHESHRNYLIKKTNIPQSKSFEIDKLHNSIINNLNEYVLQELMLNIIKSNFKKLSDELNKTICKLYEKGEKLIKMCDLRRPDNTNEANVAYKQLKKIYLDILKLITEYKLPIQDKGEKIKFRKFKQGDPSSLNIHNFNRQEWVYDPKTYTYYNIYNGNRITKQYYNYSILINSFTRKGRSVRP